VAQQVRAKRKKKPSLAYVSTCGAGLEKLVSEEVTRHGGEIVESKPGAVSWQGNLESGYRLCLWSRFASRILLQIAEFEAPDTDGLYRETGKLDWDEHFNPRDTFAVFCTLVDSKISHSKFAALRIKDAIVDQFRSRTGRRPNVDVSQPGMRINLHVQGTLATLSLDLSGDSLHRRGYRTATVEAPMKETLAAAVVHLAGWTPQFSSDAVLLDPMCGSGTLLIEAAMIYGDSAPGLLRKNFGFMFWPKHDARLWEKLVSEAVEREEKGLEKNWPRIIGFDADPQAVAAARKNVRQAGLEDIIEVNQRQIADLERPAESGLAIINPPYGERLSERDEVKHLYRFLGRKFRRTLYGWQIGFFASNPDFASTLGIDWSSTVKLYNGPIKCRLHNGIPDHIEEEPGIRFHLQSVAPEPAEMMFSECLRKSCGKLFPWAENERITCYRIYDADLPEYNFAVDLYEEWILVQEYPSREHKNQRQSADRLQSALKVIRDLLNVPPSRLFIKTGKKPEKKSPTRATSGPGRLHEVRENNCHFLVSFTDDADAGLMLDQRRIRAMIGELARGRKFLNLFGHSGPATITSLRGGAIATTTVDGSAAILQRVRANMSLNGFDGPQHTTIQQESLKWLREGRERYGLILVHPPAFSGDRHRKAPLNIQNDHEMLLRLAMQRLTREGLLIFTVNLRNFKLSSALPVDFDVREITAQTIPEDFNRTPPVHRCWEFRHRCDRNNQ